MSSTKIDLNALIKEAEEAAAEARKTLAEAQAIVEEMYLVTTGRTSYENMLPNNVPRKGDGTR